jgi:hypothetical protein
VNAQVFKQAEQVSVINRKLLIIGGAKIVHEHYKHYGKELAKYNKRLDLLKSPVVVRDRHESNGSIYHGRYFMQRYYDEGEDRIKQKYIGSRIPRELAPMGGFPPCPENPLEGLKCQLIGDNVILTEEMYERFIHLFVEHVVVPISWG